MHATIDKKVLFWPHVLPNGSVPSMVAMPDQLEDGASQFAPVDTGGAVFQIVNNGSAPLDFLTRHTRKITLPDDTVGIGIAPDSLIETCDIWLGGRELDRHRISIGNPLVGCRKSDVALVSLVNAMPTLTTGSNNAAFGASKLVFSGGTIYSWPLRLEIMRGCVVGRTHRRAPMQAVFTGIDVDTGESSGSRDFYVCVDGRSKISVCVANEGAGNVTLSCVAYEARPDDQDVAATQIAITLALDDAGSTSLVIAPNASTGEMVTFDGSPITVLRVRCVADADNTNFFVRVRAWDD